MMILQNIALNRGRNSLSSISEATGIPRSTVHRLLRVMEENEMVTLQKRGGYVIGESLLRTCLQGTGNSSILSTLIPLADEVRDATHETVSINVLSGLERMCIYRAEGDYPITRMVMIGSRAPLFYGAAGRVLAAELRQSRLEKALDYVLQTGYAQRSDIPRLLERAKSDRQNGYAVSIQERHVGCGSVAVPIKRGLTGETIAAISISALASRIEDKPTQSKYLSLLMRAAAEGNAKILI